MTIWRRNVAREVICLCSLSSNSQNFLSTLRKARSTRYEYMSWMKVGEIFYTYISYITTENSEWVRLRAAPRRSRIPILEYLLLRYERVGFNYRSPKKPRTLFTSEPGMRDFTRVTFTANVTDIASLRYFYFYFLKSSVTSKRWD